MKNFFDGVFIPKKELENAGVKYPIRLEYYKTTEENTENKYGIEIVKAKYLGEQIEIETKEIKNLTNSEEEQERILEILKDNIVTPLGVQDVLEEIMEK